MSLVAIDIDSTLYDFTLCAQEEAIRRGGDAVKVAYAQWQDWRTPPDLVGIEEWLSIIDACHSNDSILRQEPFPGAVETVQEIAQHHEIVYVSTRDPSTSKATGQWLSENDFPGGGLVATLEDKQTHISEAQFLIDDRPKTVVQFVYATPSVDHVEGPRKAFVKAHPYNMNLTDIPGIYVSPTWAGIEYYLRKKGVLPQ